MAVFFEENRAVSPVIGVVLMVAIVVLLATVVAAMVLGLDDRLQDPAPVGGFNQDYVPSGADNTDDRPYVKITHRIGETVDGENIVIRDGAGNEITWSSVWTAGPEVQAGEYVHIDGFGSDSALDPICEAGDTYTIILQDEKGQTLIVNQWTAQSDPSLPEASPSDDDGDGIPNWC
jgi:flagellin-like protein